jgi:hypothetical protein
MRYIINHHPTLVLGDNQYDYYVGMHIYVWEIMRVINQDGYVFLSQNLELPQDWVTRLRWKTHMVRFYVGSIYHPNRDMSMQMGQSSQKRVKRSSTTTSRV